MLLKAFLQEPPIRQFSAAIIRRFAKSLRTKELWDTWDRPQYLTGVLRAADQAKAEGLDEISVIEFGVASGRGLLVLQSAAEAVEMETAVKINVFGFDTGSGLLSPSGGFRDHPDRWKVGDFPMLDKETLEKKFSERTKLILGDVSSTVDDFVENIQESPIGFVAFDMDYYSATVSAFRIFSNKKRNMLRHVPLYFDDTLFFGANRFAGELLAIEEFNQNDSKVKIDRWRVLRFHRPFPDEQWLEAMYVASDFEKIERAANEIQPTAILQL